MLKLIKELQQKKAALYSNIENLFSMAICHNYTLNQIQNYKLGYSSFDWSNIQITWLLVLIFPFIIYMLLAPLSIK